MSEFDKALPWGGMKRVTLTSEGKVYKYHNPEITGDNTNAFFEDGTTMSWVDYENADYNCMVEIPKFYYCKKKIDDDWIFGVADKPKVTNKISVDEWKIHPAFFRCRDKLCDDQTGVAVEVDYRYAPAFLGSVINGKLRSLPNKSPQTATTIGNFRNYAKANGNGWGILDYNLYYAMQMLYITEYGHGDSQTKIGRGYVDDNSAKINTGGTLQYGNNTFGETTGKQQMSYRGIEDFWGNCRYWIDGFFYNGSRNILIGNKGFNNSGNGYMNYGQGATRNIGGYIGNIQNKEECGFVISATGGSATVKLYDYGYLDAGYSPIAGGCWRDGSSAGAFYFHCGSSASYADAWVAASLAF